MADLAMWDRVNTRFLIPDPIKKISLEYEQKVPPAPTAGELQVLSDRPGNKWYGRRPGGRD